MSTILPIRRKYLFSYAGSIPGGSQLSRKIFSTLSKVNDDQTDDLILLNVTCSTNGLCGTEASRRRVLSESTFAIIFIDERLAISETNQRLFEALQVISLILFGKKLYLFEAIDFIKKKAHLCCKCRGDVLYSINILGGIYSSLSLHVRLRWRACHRFAIQRVHRLQKSVRLLAHLESDRTSFLA